MQEQGFFVFRRPRRSQTLLLYIQRPFLVMEEEITSSKRLQQRVYPTITEYIQEMIYKRVVEKEKKPLKWQSRLFTVPKKGTNKLRIILDLSFLNQFIKYPTFKVLTLKEGKMLLFQDLFTTSINLKDRQGHVPIHLGGDHIQGSINRTPSFYSEPCYLT